MTKLNVPLPIWAMPVVPSSPNRRWVVLPRVVLRLIRLLSARRFMKAFALPATVAALPAPKFGDKAAWAPRLKVGLDEVQKIATKGLNAMPPKGGFGGSDAEFRAAIEYMANAAK
ncbi:c-type cytochrome [Paludibacterium denitrificans]|uniref:c-type cytochrome n=1 Tax=Paludibacterium denitrificans TaxID=2675226 RepID=UPI0035E41D9C